MSAQDAVQSYRQAFDALAAQRAEEPGWLAQARDAAMARFESQGLPTHKMEAWKYTNLRAVAAQAIAHPLQRAPKAITASALDQIDFKGLDSLRLVFVDGVFSPDLSDLTRGSTGRATLGALSSALTGDSAEAVKERLGQVAPSDRAMVALNTALFTDGLFLHVPRGAVMETPVHVIHVATEGGGEQAAGSAWARNLVIMEEGSQATIFESYVGPSGSPHLSDVVTEVFVADAARLIHARIHDEGLGAFAFHNTHAVVGRDAHYDLHGVLVGGALVRNESRVRLVGKGGFCGLRGVYPLTGRQHVDNSTEVEHEAPHCDSFQLFKCVAHGRSRGVFQGKIHVHRDAQKTNAIQNNANIILSQGAVADTKPQLEIYADDVRCTHGATVGQLDDKQVFYLRSRGLDLGEARRLLTRGFAFESIENLAEVLPEGFRGPVTERLDTLLGARMASFGEA